MAIKTTDLNDIGFNRGDKTTRLALKAANAALAFSIPREDVLDRMQAMNESPEEFTGDLLFADVAHRLRD